MGPNPTLPFGEIEKTQKATVQFWWEEYMQHVTFCYRTGRHRRELSLTLIVGHAWFLMYPAL